MAPIPSENGYPNQNSYTSDIMADTSLKVVPHTEKDFAGLKSKLMRVITELRKLFQASNDRNAVIHGLLSATVPVFDPAESTLWELHHESKLAMRRKVTQRPVQVLDPKERKNLIHQSMYLGRSLAVDSVIADPLVNITDTRQMSDVSKRYTRSQDQRVLSTELPSVEGTQIIIPVLSKQSDRSRMALEMLMGRPVPPKATEGMMKIAEKIMAEFALFEDRNYTKD